jgi:hypothetical protein
MTVFWSMVAGAAIMLFGVIFGVTIADNTQSPVPETKCPFDKEES